MSFHSLCNGNPKERQKPHWKPWPKNIETICIRESVPVDDESDHVPLTLPITLSVLHKDSRYTKPGAILAEYQVHNPYAYSRFGCATRTFAEGLLAKIEGAKYGLLVAAGVGAVSTVLSLMSHGDHVIRTKSVYSEIKNAVEYYQNYGIPSSVAPKQEIESILSCVNDKTKLVILDNPTNPLLEVLDTEVLVKKLKEINSSILVAVDNSLMTSVLYRPLDHGVDIVIYSCSKYINGHGDIIIGGITTNSEVLYQKLFMSHTLHGNVPSPFNCYLLVRSIKLLPIRMKRHCENAQIIALYLETHRQAENVKFLGLPSHPQHEVALKLFSGGSGVISFHMKGGNRAAEAFLKALKIFHRGGSFGYDFSLACTMPWIYGAFIDKVAEESQEMGITSSLVRLSIGLENTDLLIEDLKRGFSAAYESVLNADHDIHSPV